MSLPHVPSAIRQFLLGDLAFNAACHGRCSTRAPSDVTQPYAIVQVSGGYSLSGDGVAWSPLVQVDGWCAPGGTEDPEVAAWRIAAEAGRVLGRARNITYQAMTYSARLVDGPLSGVDTSRGTSTPLYRALVRAELAVHTS